MGTAWRTAPNADYWCRVHALRGRFGRDQLGVLGLQGLQLPHQSVVLGIRDGGLVVDVIADIVLFDFSAQARRGLRRVSTVGRAFHISYP